MSNIPIVLTQQQQAQTIANYLPGGKAFSAKNLIATNIRKLLLGFSIELVKIDNTISIFRTDSIPDETQYFIGEWEKAVGIPDSCFSGSGTDDERRLNIVVKLSSLGIQTDPDFVELASKYGINIEVESGSVHGTFPYTFPAKFYPSAQHARFTLVIRPTIPIGPVFEYTFPITFGSNQFVILECLFNKLKPANVDLVFENPL